MKYLLFCLISTFFLILLNGCSDPAQNQQNLIDAAMNGDKKQVDTLLTKQTNPDSRDKCEWTPLMQAVLYNHPEIVKSLLAKGAATELADQAGYNALLIAATHNRHKMISLLLTYHADINYQAEEDKMTALMIAARAGYKETTTVLLKHGADKKLLDKQGRTALKWAELKQHPHLVQLLQ